MKGKLSLFSVVFAYCCLLALAKRECFQKQYGYLTPDSNDCSKYYRCDGQVNTQELYWKHEKCPPYQYYNSTVHNCIPNYGSCNTALITQYIHCRDNDTILDPSDSKKYFICENDGWALRHCVHRHIFNETEGQCVLEKQCISGTNKYDVEDCSQYFVCNQNSEWVLMKCKADMYFNRDENKCEIDINNVCDTKFTNPPSTTVKPTTIKPTTIKPKTNPPSTTIKPKTQPPSTTVRSSTKQPPKTINPKKDSLSSSTELPSLSTKAQYVPDKCIERTTKPDLQDCARYFTCTNGTWNLNLCPENHYFDIFFLDCRTDYEGICKSSTYNDNNKLEFLCKDDDVKANEQNCMKYLKCSNHMWIPMICEDGTYYNEDVRECVTDNGECNNKPQGVLSENEVTPGIIKHNNNCDEGQTKLDALDCGRYYECSDDKWVSKECNINKYYDNIKKQCVINNGKCDRDSSEDKKIHKSIERNACETGETKPDHFDCTRYYTCRNEKWVPAQCKPRMYYDDDKSKCILDDGTCNEDLKNHLTTKKAKIPLKNCDEGETKNHILDCKKYYLCENGIWKSVKCESKMYYNSDRKRCIIDDGSCQSIDSEDEKSNDNTCKNDDMKVDEISCNRYYYCRDQAWVLLSCPQRYYFNESSRYCLPNIGNCETTVSDSKTAECTEGKFKSNYKHESQYQECINTKWVAKSCKTGFKFNMVSRECEKKLNVEKENTRTERQMSAVQEKCEDGKVKIKEGSKMAYYTCSNGVWELKTCPGGFIFDLSSTICMPDMNLRNLEITKSK
ncbi:uncharacterized protein LOC129613500 [Condylostylus longicornis]|uniref:uncharacterized protein LOC129613500 n=1 Tax=Condylostylus longicornis TaxID=2530218 RepID=UPI00244E2647|nr:uncharacterized protein LOC129613500 [Condylostylus longicornis]